MAFPESERVVYEHNPLEQVVCELRFPTILKISATEPADFQDRIRASYPNYTKQQPVAGVPEEFSRMLAQVGMPVPTQAVVHTFATENGVRSISLTQDFVGVTARQYRVWEELFDEVQRAKAALEDVYQPTHYIRIGLRYIDVIKRTELELGNTPWRELLNPQLIGALGTDEVGDQVLQIGTDSLLSLPEVPDGQLRLRHGLQTPDVYRFDADFYVGERRASADVPTILNRFHALAGHLFRWAIAPRLRDALRPTPVAVG